MWIARVSVLAVILDLNAVGIELSMTWSAIFFRLGMLPASLRPMLPGLEGPVRQDYL
jgi:hypothetical protein